MLAEAVQQPLLGRTSMFAPPDSISAISNSNAAVPRRKLPDGGTLLPA